MLQRWFAAILAVVVCAGATPAAAERFAARDIRFEDVTGEVRIITNAGDAIDVVVRHGRTVQPMTVALVDGAVIVKGSRWREEEARTCCNTRIRRTADLRRDRGLAAGKSPDPDVFDHYPVLEVTMPRAGNITFRDARVKLSLDAITGALALHGCYVYGETRDVGQATIELLDGSRLQMGNIAGMLELDLSGDADLTAGDAAMADIDIAGPGDVVLGTVDGIADISIAGSGRVRAARVDGPLTVRIAGSGSVMAQAGRADPLKATIDGSGGVYLPGGAKSADLRLYGSSEVHLGALEGRLKHSGAGEVFVAGRAVERR